jgi:hypothetical protein
MSATRFCYVFLGAALFWAAFIATFNFLVDPYLIFDAARLKGFNAVKPAVATRERMMKAYHVSRVQARTVILGSSRTDIGLDPAHVIWPHSAHPVYNLSLVGADIETGLKYLRHMVASSASNASPKTLVVGLDFEYFLIKPNPPAKAAPAAPTAPRAANELEERLAVDATGNVNPARVRRVLQDKALALLSLDAIIDSASTIWASNSLNSTDLQANGHLSDAVFRQNVIDDGAAALFDQKNAQTVSQLATPRRVLSEYPGAPIREMRAINELLNFASEHGMGVIFAVQPAHVSRLELLDRMGYWEDYERWKRELTALVASERDKHRDVVVWDFGGYEEYAQETVPTKTAGQGKMQWFWDPVHYTSALGDIMVSRMFHNDDKTDYGVELTPKNLESRLAQVRRDRADFRARMPLETARLLRVCGNSCSGQASTLTYSR